MNFNLVGVNRGGSGTETMGAGPVRGSLRAGDRLLPRLHRFCQCLVLVLLLLPADVSAQMAAKVVRTRVAGIDVLAYRTGVEQIVTIRGSLPAGDAFCPPENPALATLVAGMLDKGTTQQGKFAMAEKLERVGATISFSAGNHDLTFSARCLQEDLPLVLGLLAEQLRTPAFVADEFEKYQRQLIGSLKRQLEDTSARADIAFSQAIYPVGHPNRQAGIEELIVGVEATKLEEVRAFHSAHYGPAGMTLVAVGDVQPAQLQAGIERGFSGWAGGNAAPRPAPGGAAGADVAKEQTVIVPGKTSVDVAWGMATGLKYRDPDALALRVGTAILGSGFTGRLMANVRDKEGLTYGIYSYVGNDTFSDGDWQITATFAPTLVAKGIESARRQLLQWYDQGITAAELAQRQRELVGNFQVNLATTGGLALSLLTTVQRGLDLSWLDQYPERIEALTLEHVNRAIRTHLDPAKMVIIQAGTLPAGSR